VAAAASAGPTAEEAAPVEEVEAVDPVCGMSVTAASSAHPFEYQGTTYYFCCAGCRREFEKNPTAYVKEDAS
jgi:YHS domain-containing protein